METKTCRSLLPAHSLDIAAIKCISRNFVVNHNDRTGISTSRYFRLVGSRSLTHRPMSGESIMGLHYVPTVALCLV
jgi:hypothetical protein